MSVISHQLYVKQVSVKIILVPTDVHVQQDPSFYMATAKVNANTNCFFKVAPYCFLKSVKKVNVNLKKYPWIFWKRMKLNLYIEQLSEHQIVLMVKCLICCYCNSDVSKWQNINI